MNGIKSTSARRITIGLGLVIALIATTAGPANALVVNTSGSSASISTWRISSTDRHQTASGQDIRLKLTSGPGIDARWYKCTDNVHVYGPIRSDIYVSSGWRVIGTDFLDDSCFNMGWRGADVIGTWQG